MEFRNQESCRAEIWLCTLRSGYPHHSGSLGRCGFPVHLDLLPQGFWSHGHDGIL
ncbi:unnamed protein product [Periconia digitata]|uniref:Uncharacterized protein n=1 Tax=Periconia digitata TaxID=1303443 RepID=A0A9W4U431_9PLEO|nr:unnamed protein product [Periconia digitata]